MIESLLLAGLWDTRLWYAVPLIAVISLVYGATKYEAPARIARSAGETALWILVFMAIVYAVIWVFSWGL